MRWASAWRLAVGTLTVLPVRPPSVVDRRVAGRAMLLGPVAVLPLAVMAAGLGRLAASTAWPSLLSGLVVVASLALGTRALHLDGLADTVDGLGSGRDRQRALEIMRRGDVGPMGVVALVLVVGGQAVAAGALISTWPGAALVTVVIAISRTSLLLACRAGVPPARPGGLGATVAGSVRPLLAVVGGLVSALVLVGTLTVLGRPWWIAALALIVGALAACGMVWLAVRRLGGITGDVLGAVVELTLLALLLAVSV
jgi:adenosylcobinamide-GDP ribazoletransferase